LMRFLGARTGVHLARKGYCSARRDAPTRESCCHQELTARRLL
jgi:hypothetical protein